MRRSSLPESHRPRDVSPRRPGQPSSARGSSRLSAAPPHPQRRARAASRPACRARHFEFCAHYFKVGHQPGNAQRVTRHGMYAPRARVRLGGVALYGVGKAEFRGDVVHHDRCVDRRIRYAFLSVQTKVPCKSKFGARHTCNTLRLRPDAYALSYICNSIHQEIADTASGAPRF